MSEIDHRWFPPLGRRVDDALHGHSFHSSGRSRITAGAERRIGAEMFRTNGVSFAAQPSGKRRSRRRRRLQMVSAPEIERVSMAPRKLERGVLHRLRRKLGNGSGKKTGQRSAAGAGAEKSPGTDTAQPPWRRVARRRRILLALAVSTQTAVACWSLARTFAAPQLSEPQVAIVLMFAVLFSWVSYSFWTNVAGFCRLWRNRKVCRAAADHTSLSLRGRTALVMPICNEDVGRCFAGIEAMYRSLAGTGEIGKFDFFILSDSTDPDRQAEEELAWAQICRALRRRGKIFYRRRRVNIKRKSGNVADFLRRWSRRYDYMIVLDADSLMAGETMVRLARMMEQSPQTGIIQTVPTIVNRASLFARIQQFANRVYGPLSSASLDFWQMGDSAYWGHNAIIRVEPFVKHCALAQLPGRAPLGGEILSHDFVEAALMGRAEMEVWMALDVQGSYEESPPSLLDELKRDQRWCQGNLQHLRLLFADGFKAGHRAVFAMGVMAYGSALLWAGFLVLNTIEAANQSLSPLNYFSSKPSLFPIWPQWRPEWAIALASTTALMLFLPKLMSFLWIVKNGEARRFGGIIPLGVSILLETIVSTLLAPLRMWFHSKFVLVTLLGRSIQWRSQKRSESGTDWRAALRAQWFCTVVAGGWIAAMFRLAPGLFVWMLPVALPLLLSIPLSVYSSRVSLGRASRRRRLFLIPEEISPPRVLNELRKAMEKHSSERWSSDEFYVDVSSSERETLQEILGRRLEKYLHN